MNFTIVNSGPKEADIIMRWHEERSIPFEIKFLSTTGQMAYIDGKPIAAADLYFTNSGWVLLENFISDPKSDKLVRREACAKLAESLIKVAKAKGYKVLTSHVYQDSMRESLAKAGMTQNSLSWSLMGTLLGD